MKKTIEELENWKWGESEGNSHVVTECHRLRKKPIDEFTIEDLRIMIGQNIGLPYLMPRALEILDVNPLAEGDYYPGDLLVSVCQADPSFLKDHPEFTSRISSVARHVANSPEAGDLIVNLNGFLQQWDR